MTMRRLLMLLAPIAGALGIAACHNPGSAWNECYANRPHSGDNMQYNSAATFSFGVYSCRVHHSGGYTGIYHTFCMHPDAHTKFSCTGPAGQVSDVEATYEPEAEPDHATVQRWVELRSR